MKTTRTQIHTLFNTKVANSACAALLVSTLAACGGGGGGSAGEGNADNTSSSGQVRSVQAESANVPLTVLLRDGERIFDSVIDSYIDVNDFYGDRNVLATLVNEQLAAYTGQAEDAGFISDPTFVNDLYAKMLELPSVKGVDEDGNHIELTPELLQQVKAGEIVVSPITSAEDIQTLNFTQYKAKDLTFYQELIETESDVLGVTDLMKEHLDIDLRDTEGTVFGVVETVLEFRDKLTGIGDVEEDITDIKIRLEEMSVALQTISTQLENLKVTMIEEFNKMQMLDLANRLDDAINELQGAIELFNAASNDTERRRYATELDLVYEKSLSTLLDAILDHDKGMKQLTTYSNNTNIEFDMRINAKYDYLQVNLPSACDQYDVSTNYLNNPTLSDRQNGLTDGYGGGFNFTGHNCDWMSWYLLDYGYASFGDGGTLWKTNKYDVNNLVLDSNGQGADNEINVPVLVPENFSAEIKDPEQYTLAYSEGGVVDFLEIFTSFVYARYLINPWVNDIDSTEAKNSAISERHINMITTPVSQINGTSRSVKDELLAVYEKMMAEHFDIFNNVVGAYVVDGHQIIQNNPLVFKNWLAGHAETLNSEDMAYVARSITYHLQDPNVVSSYYATYSPKHWFDIPEIDIYAPTDDRYRRTASFSEFDQMWQLSDNTYFTGEYLWTDAIKLNGKNNVVCCVLKPGTPVSEAVDVYPSVRIRANDDAWGAVDIGAVENGEMSKLLKLFMGAKTNKLLKTAARLATMEIVLKTHCLGLNPDEERFAECDIK